MDCLSNRENSIYISICACKQFLKLAGCWNKWRTIIFTLFKIWPLSFILVISPTTWEIICLVCCVNWHLLTSFKSSISGAGLSFVETVWSVVFLELFFAVLSSCLVCSVVLSSILVCSVVFALMSCLVCFVVWQTANPVLRAQKARIFVLYKSENGMILRNMSKISALLLPRLKKWIWKMKRCIS